MGYTSMRDSTSIDLEAGEQDWDFCVVTPNYNMGEHLEETIESVLLNLGPNDEYFIVDGGSRDGSLEIIKNYERHLTGWISEPDNGYADALAKGFNQTTGEFMGWINCGDLLLRGCLSEAKEEFHRTGADLIFGDDVYIDEGGKVIAHSRGHVRSLRKMMLYGGWAPLQDACFWRRSLYERVGGINPSIKDAADYDFFLHTSWAGKSVYVPKIFSAFRRHSNQKSIARSSDYESERQLCRQRMLKELAISKPRGMVAEMYYKSLVRWRHYVSRYFYGARVPLGTSAMELTVD